MQILTFELNSINVFHHIFVLRKDIRLFSKVQIFLIVETLLALNFFEMTMWYDCKYVLLDCTRISHSKTIKIRRRPYKVSINKPLKGLYIFFCYFELNFVTFNPRGQMWQYRIWKDRKCWRANDWWHHHHIKSEYYKYDKLKAV